MRIAYVCADRGVPVFGGKGGSIHVQAVVRGMVAMGATVDMFARRYGGDPPGGLRGVRLHQLPKGERGEVVVRERSDLEANMAIRDLLTEVGPFDVVYERHSLWCFAAQEYARAKGVPGLLEVNAPLLEEQRQYRRLILEAEAKRSVDRAYGAASALLAVSSGVARYLSAHPACRAPVHVVANGVDPDRFAGAITPALPRPDDGAFTVGFVGTLKPWHGAATLVKAVAEMRETDPGTRLLIVGDGPERDDLQGLAYERGLGDDAIFTGAVDPAAVPAMLASMDVAVAPYPPTDDFYFSPLKIFEYMAAARPIVAAAIGQIDELLDDGTNALLYPPGDRAALVAALRRLRAEPGLGERLGCEARRVAVKNHTWTAVVRRIIEIAERSASGASAVSQVG